jgi:Fur family ferric uptake transcriptional regulator
MGSNSAGMIAILEGTVKLENQELKKAGLKVTAPRVKILHILETSLQSTGIRHLSAEDVYKKLLDMGDDVGLATVYRVLTQFESAGLVIRHHFEGGHSVFELDDGKHHDHLVCIKCGQVVEFIDPVIEQRQEAIAKEKQFRMTDHALYIYGVCVHCEST